VSSPEELKKGCIMSLLRGAKRYHFAALQDKHPLVGARHNAYAVALVDALNSVSNEEEVKKMSGVSLKQLRAAILKHQDKLEGQAMKVLEELQKKGINLNF
jgi:rhamnogalacturonyl hydrolase YesR